MNFKVLLGSTICVMARKKNKCILNPDTTKGSGEKHPGNQDFNQQLI